MPYLLLPAILSQLEHGCVPLYGRVVNQQHTMSGLLLAPQVAAMLPEAYTSMCEGYTAAFSRLLAEPRTDDDPVFLHRAVRT